MIDPLFTLSYVNGVDYICVLETSYMQMITAMNRALPVAIAVYRYQQKVASLCDLWTD